MGEYYAITSLLKLKKGQATNHRVEKSKIISILKRYILFRKNKRVEKKVKKKERKNTFYSEGKWLHNGGVLCYYTWTKRTEQMTIYSHYLS